MRGQRRILLTGPVAELHRYADAARSVGWEPIPFPLLEIRDLGVDLTQTFEEPPDWVCVTSRNALPAVERVCTALLSVPFATVGRSSAAALRELGLQVPMDGAHSARDLADRLAPEIEPGSHVLWPRGSRSQGLAELLREAGSRVSDPVVYETVERRVDGNVPLTRAVFFASPSAVTAYCKHTLHEEQEQRAALAIGPTTWKALEDMAGRFPQVSVLDEATPLGLEKELRRLFEI